MDFATGYTLEFVAESLPASACRILEVGCGHGQLAAQLETMGHEVVGLDSDREAVVAALSIDVDARLAAWPDFSDGDFDAVVFTRSLHHIHDLDAAVVAAFDALRPNGRVIVEDFDVDYSSDRSLEWFRGICRVAESLGARWEENGFVAKLLAASPPLKDAWDDDHHHHHHPLHGAEVIERSLSAHGRLQRASGAAYLFRYAVQGLVGPATIEAIARSEIDLISAKGLDPLGRRFVATSNS